MDNLERTLGKILATQEHIVDRIDEFSSRLETHIKEDKDMERRLDKIEHRISYFTGMIVVVASLFSLLSTFLFKEDWTCLMTVKRTLLEMTQSLLAAMDSDEVNSIGDTVESYDIALLFRDVFYDIAVELELTSHETLFELQASGDPLQPTLMTLPENVKTLSWIKYNNILSTETVSNYVPCYFKKFDEFLKMQTSIRENDATGEMTVELNSEFFEFIYQTDKMPQWYTHVGNETILFDSYDSAEDTTLMKSKTLCGGVVYPTFLLEDSFIVDLDASQFPYYFNKAKARAFLEKKQVDNREAVAEARNQKKFIQKNKDRVVEGTALQKMNLGRYGRK